ncbi:MAG TPA: RidA family protein [Beijerinckiaceae bacterium]|jgi:enamine deaminase RidA (YjgF/YER057c/UK114 family)
MTRFLNPPTIMAPGSRYSHGVEHRLGMRRLVISGQVGIRPDSTVPEGLEAQAEAALDNLTVRDRQFAGHAPASTYLEIAGLASPRFLVEIEGEAVKEFEP